MKKLVSKIISEDIVSQVSSASRSYFLMLEDLVDSTRLKLIKSQLKAKDLEIKRLKFENIELKKCLSGVVIKLEKDHLVMQDCLCSLKNAIKGISDE